MKALTITVPDPVARWLPRTAEQRKQTEAEVATATLAAAAEPPEPSLGDLLAEFKGVGEGRHTDLSTNKSTLWTSESGQVGTAGRKPCRPKPEW